ncbi:MAG: hypothetical protein WAU24_09515 [Chitinophagaceae bacterium]
MKAHYNITLHFSILLFSVPAFLSACFDTTQQKGYSVTAYFTSFDSSSNAMDKEGQKFKFSYEDYNADSNLVYQELYATANNFGDMWGKLFEKMKYFYNGKEKMRAEREFGIALPPSETGKGKGKEVYTYEYRNGLLIKWLSDGRPVEEYKYNYQNEEVEKRIFNVMNVPEYYQYTYVNGLKTNSRYFVADTIVSIDTFIYDKNKQLVEKYSYDSEGEMIGHDKIIRNDKGQIIEKKWREPFTGWRIRNDGQIIGDEFYQSNKYYYDGKGRLIKKEFYDIGKLMTVYEFTYDS